MKRTGARVIWRCHIGHRPARTTSRARRGTSSAPTSSRPTPTSSRARRSCGRGSTTTRSRSSRRRSTRSRPRTRSSSPRTVARHPRRGRDRRRRGAATRPSSAATAARRGSSSKAELYEDTRLTPDDPIVLQVSRWDRAEGPARRHPRLRRARRGARDGRAPRLRRPGGRGGLRRPGGHARCSRRRSRCATRCPTRRSAASTSSACRWTTPRRTRRSSTRSSARADVVVQKSIAEGFGLTVAEAMWKARPVVATAVGGIQDQIVDGETGVLLADPRDLDAYGEAVRGLLEDPERAKRIGEAAKRARARPVPRRAQPARLPQPDLAAARLTLGESPADEQRRPSRRRPRRGGRAGRTRPRRRSGSASGATVSSDAAHGRRPSPPPSPSCPSRACAWRPRCPPPRSRSASPQAAQRARPQPAHPRLPQGQGAAAGDHPARRPRGRARRGGPRVDRRLVQRRHRRRQGRPRRRARPRPRRAAGRGRAAALLDRDRRPPDGQARRVRGARGRPPRARGRRRGDRQARSSSCASAWPSSRPSSAPPPSGDFVVMDFLGTLDGEPFGGGEGRDQMVELGSGRLVPGLRGAARGRVRRRRAHGQDRVPRGLRRRGPRRQGGRVRGHRQGGQGQGAARARRRLRRRGRLRHARRAARRTSASASPRRRPREIEAEFREAALDAAVAARHHRGPDALVEARARELWEQMAHTLAHQGISKETYLQIAGKTEDEVIADNREPAERDLRREAVLAAVVEAEGIEASDDDVLEALERAAAAEGTHAEEAARAPALHRPARVAAGRPRAAQGDRPPRDRRADPGRAGRRARSSGRRQTSRTGRCERPLDAGTSLRRGWPAARPLLDSPWSRGVDPGIARRRIRTGQAKRSEDHEPTRPHGRRADLRGERAFDIYSRCSTSGSSSSARRWTIRSRT